MLIDIDQVNRNADLIALTGVPLKRVASTGGGEWAGPCPFCGGKDRFRVEPNYQPKPRWMCRQCGRRGDAIELGRQLWPGLPFREVCERLTGGNIPTRSGTAAPRTAIVEPVRYAPHENWQRQAREVINRGIDRLWAREGERARRWLNERGLVDATLKTFRIGYENHKIIIPCVVNGIVWYVKYRHATGARKYSNLTGGAVGIFNADDLLAADLCLMTEGEIDCMIAWQALNAYLPVATAGSAANRPDTLHWARYFRGKRAVFAVYDNDEAGQAGIQHLASLTGRLVPLTLPQALADKPIKDVNDFTLAGGDLLRWLEPHLHRHAPLTGSMVDAALACGAQVALQE